MVWSGWRFASRPARDYLGNLNHLLAPFRAATSKGLQSVNEIAAAHKVHPSQVATWKKELLEGGSEVFERKPGKSAELKEQEADTARLERTLGRVVVEKEFLVKKCRELGIEP